VTMEAALWCTQFSDFLLLLLEHDTVVTSCQFVAIKNKKRRVLRKTIKHDFVAFIMYYEPPAEHSSQSL
jgi:hypothetical protein